VLVEATPASDGMEVFSTLHFYAIDVITAFLYGTTDFGATTALTGHQAHVSLLNDIMDPSRRRLAWSAVHLPILTLWLYSRAGLLKRLVKPSLPMQKPITYSDMRAHALLAMQQFRDTDAIRRAKAQNPITAWLWKFKGDSALGDLDIASECADDLLAGINITSDTLMFLIWALSRPKHAPIQRKLIDECKSIDDDAVVDGAVNPDVADRLSYLDAVIKGTLRLYTPLPASEPRSSPVDVVIDGYQMPRGGQYARWHHIRFNKTLGGFRTR
jgi:cytochrome P450